MSGLLNRPRRSGVFERRRSRDRDAAPRLARALILTIVALIGVGLVWAARTEITELSRAEARIVPLGELRVVEHLEGGILQEILAAEGDSVAAGQVIARLSSEALDLERNRLALREARALGDATRLRALLAALDASAPPEGGAIPGAPAPEAAALALRAPKVAAEAAGLYRAQLAAWRAQAEALQARRREAARAAALAEERRDSLAERQKLMEARHAMSQTLARSGRVSRATEMELGISLSEIRGDRMEAEADLHAALVSEREARRAALDLSLSAREGWLAELTEADEALGLAREALADNAARRARLELRAPVAGRIQSLGVRAPGEVIEPGGAVAEILPTELSLAAEARLSPLDIGHVAPGAPVELKLTTFDEKRFGSVQGEVVDIAPTSSEDEEGRTYFRVVVALDAQTIGAGADTRPLRAGMEARAEIRTASRTVLTYLLKPVERTFGSAFHER
ncbi:MAG: hypothetical protein CML46_01600 [Rhodobacteraceae bacterium]|nr:hypothetical protein [Paracoccaceae bacterium]MBR25637.1 hypothetical protein [Paracoccaceae bacterium]